MQLTMINLLCINWVVSVFYVQMEKSLLDRKISVS